MTMQNASPATNPVHTDPLLAQFNRLGVRSADGEAQHYLREISWFFGTSTVMRNLAELMQQMAGSDVPALLCGEVGIGKSLLARALHVLSGNRGHFVIFDVAAVPLSQLEKELSHALSHTIIDDCAGTLFVSGVDNLPLLVQQRLVQNYRSYRATESARGKPVPRLICSARQRLDELVQQGLFSERLFREINAVTLLVPPLRQRPEDIPGAVNFFIGLSCQEGQRNVRFNKDAMRLLQSYPWLGNLRELSAVIQQSICRSGQDIITAEMVRPLLRHGEGSTQCSLPEAAHACLSHYFESLRGMAPAPDLYDRVMSEVERPLIEHVLRYARGNQLRAAEILGLNRNTLRKKIRLLEIDVKKVVGK